MTPYISSYDKPGLLTLRWNPVLQGFVWSHQSKLVLISTHQYALAGWVFCNRAFFILFFVNMLTSPIISQVLWRHTSNFYWINSLSQLSELDDFVSFPSYGYNLETERESDTDLSTTDMMYAWKKDFSIFLAVVSSCHLPDSNSYNSFVGAKASTAWKNLYIKKRKRQMYVINFVQSVGSFVLGEIELNSRSHWILGHTLVCSSLLSLNVSFLSNLNS